MQKSEAKVKKFKRKGKVSYNDTNMAETTYHPMQVCMSVLSTMHLPQMNLLRAEIGHWN